MALLKVMVVSTSKVEEVLLEQQIVWLQEGKLLHIVTTSSCSYVDLELAVSLPFKF